VAVKICVQFTVSASGSLAEWLTRCPAKALPIGRAGSNPAAVVI
tara:strand:- start:506 stop:637 length:132 start_codon:yes stop_codon:yes gene_type:complete